MKGTLKNLLANAPLTFPDAREWMWDYCIYLGPYVDYTGKHYDLGIYMSPHTGSTSAAIVYGNEPGDYISGPIDPTQSGMMAETSFRARTLHLI